MISTLLSYPFNTAVKKNSFFQPKPNLVQRQESENIDTLNKNFNYECRYTDQEGIKRIRKNSYYCMSMLDQIEKEELKKSIRKNPYEDKDLLEVNDSDWAQIDLENKAKAERILIRLLKKLEEGSSWGFLEDLRNLSDTEKNVLQAHGDINTAFKKYLSLEALLNVKIILKYGNKIPESIRKMKIALNEKNIFEIKNIILFYEDIRAENSEISQEMIEVYLKDDQRKHDILFYYFTVISSSEHYNTQKSKNTHYEYDTEKDKVELKVYNSSLNYKIVRDITSFHVFVPLEFVDQDSNLVPFGDSKEDDQILINWLVGVSSYWNNRFKLTNGIDIYPLIFNPFMSHEKGCQIRVIRNSEKEKKSRNDKDWRTNSREWEIHENSNVAAHEFGHLIGASDEYELPKNMSDIPASLNLSQLEKINTTVEGKGGKPHKGKFGYTYDNLMGGGIEVLVSHVKAIEDDINANHLQQDEKPFHIIRK